MYGRLLGIQSRRLYFPNAVHRNYLKPQLRTVLYCLFVPNFALGESLINSKDKSIFSECFFVYIPDLLTINKGNVFIVNKNIPLTTGHHFQ